jgi:glucosyl-dolichyl phosphate glucuronosyltransferase
VTTNGLHAQGSADVSVVVCTYAEQRRAELIDVVASVQAQLTPPREIVVVVDHNPRLFEAVRTWLPDVVAVENTGGRGLSGARNTGVWASAGAVVAFLDDDSLAAPDWLELLLAGYERPGVIGVGGSIEPLWLAGKPKAFPPEFDWVVGGTHHQGPLPTARPVRNLQGGNMSFQREVFDAVGGFFAGIGRSGTYPPAGCEETDFCIRLRRRWPDGVLLYEPRARVRHRVPAKRAGWAYFRSRCYAEGLSKAVVAARVGAEDGLSAERSYVWRMLPRGIARGLADAVLRRDLSGVGRASAILAGLSITTAGYAVGAVSATLAGRRGQVRR